MGLFRARLSLGRCFGGGFNHFVQQRSELFQTRGGDDDSITPASDILSDAQEASARILFQGEDKGLSLDLNLGGLQRILVDGRLGRTKRTITMRAVSVCTVAIRRWTVVRNHIHSRSGRPARSPNVII